MTMGLLGLLLGCQSCRVGPEDSAKDITIALGEVWLGGEVARQLPLEVTSITSDEDLIVTAKEDHVELWWTPTTIGDVSLSLDAGGQAVTLTATVSEPAVWPETLATHIGYEPLDSLDVTELGDAMFPATGEIPIGIDPINGEAWFGAADQGRAWRLDPFYNHATWGLWVSLDFEEKGVWMEAPDCFGEDTSGLRQTGICTGAERDIDGSIPENWRYLHGGFVGTHAQSPGDALTGLSAMVTDEDRARIWLLGTDEEGSWMRGIDLGLEPGAGEGIDEDPYTFRQLLPDVIVPLDEAGGQLRGGLQGSDLWTASLETGRISTVTIPDGVVIPLTTLDGLLAIGQAGEVLLALTSDQILGIQLSSGEASFAYDRPAGLPSGEPLATWSTDDAVWMVFESVLLKLSADDEPLVVLPPREVRLVGLVDDVVSGGTAASLSMLYIIGDTDSGGVLLGASPEGVWYGDPLSLPATPRAIGHARDPHDIFILYPAGSEGCDAGLECEDGVHPPVVHSLYNPYGLVPPTSTGHPLNLFLSPIAETPKDNSLGSDFSQGPCGGKQDDTYSDVSCCALDWVLTQRLMPNVDYFTGVLQSLGSDTESSDDDPTLVWGINPTVLRQAYECMESENPADIAAGVETYSELLALSDVRSSIANWTHTAGGEDRISEPQNWFVTHAPDDSGYTAPVSNQSEYGYLHDGMSALFDPTRLPVGAGALLDADPASMWTPLVSGNALDAYYISLFDGWSEPDWLSPIRDAPRAVNQPPRQAYYFLSAGVELEIGMTKWRKKELYPYDIRQRQVHWLSSDINAPGAGDPSSEMINLPGMSWEIGTIGALSEAGAYRETIRFAVEVDETDWMFVRRYLRRLISSSQPEDIKSWYLHIFDVTSPNGLFTDNSSVSNETDINRESIEWINETLVTPGHARWALPEEILMEWDDAQ